MPKKYPKHGCYTKNTPPLSEIRSFSDRLVIAATPLSDGRRALNGYGKKLRFMFNSAKPK